MSCQEALLPLSAKGCQSERALLQGQRPQSLWCAATEMLKLPEVLGAQKLPHEGHNSALAQAAVGSRAIQSGGQSHSLALVSKVES